MEAQVDMLQSSYVLCKYSVLLEDFDSRCNFFSLITNHRISPKVGAVKNIYLFKRIFVRLIDDVFLNMGFKTETQLEKVIILNVSLLSLFSLFTLFSIFFRFAFNWELNTTCGRTNAP